MSKNNVKKLEELFSQINIQDECESPNHDSASEFQSQKYAHILEIFEFDKSLETRDIVEDLNEFFEAKNQARDYFKLKWVDDFACLCVFESERVATNLLNTTKQAEVEELTATKTTAGETARQTESYSFKRFRLRAVNEQSSKKVRFKILKSPGDWQLPYKKRPAVSVLSARRMILTDLKMTHLITPEETKKQRDEIQARKELRRSERLREKTEQLKQQQQQEELLKLQKQEIKESA